MSRKSVVTSAASAVGIVAIAAALVVAVAHGGPNRSSAAGDGAPTSTTPSSAPTSAAPIDLAALTAAIPCPDDKTPRVSPDALTGFGAVAVFTCGDDIRTYADGEWSVQIREAATPDIASVETAIQAPPPPEPSGEYFCDDVLYGEPALVFVDADGHTLVPKFHRDSCGVPVGLDATRTIHWHELSVRKDTLQQSAEEIAAGCSHQYKNMNYYEAQYGDQKVSGGGPVFPDDGALLDPMRSTWARSSRT
jgi:hypothetical protein